MSINNDQNKNDSIFDEYGRYKGPSVNEPPYKAPENKGEPKKNLKNWTTASNRDMVFVLLCLVFSVVTVDFYLWGGIGAGLSVCAVAILAVTFCFLAVKGIKIRAYTVFSSLAYLFTSASLGFSDAGLPKFLAILLLVFLYSVILVSCMPLRRYEGGTYKSLADVMYAMFVLPFGRIGRTWYAIFHKPEGKKIITRKTGSIFIGFALAIPALCVIIPLLMYSDAAFEGLLDKVTAGKVFEIIISVIIGAVVCLFWFGQIYGAGEVKREQKSPRDRKGIEPTILASFLSVLSIAYALYIFSQLAYFFNGFSGLLPDGFTTAEYARRGFFEMTTVCAINLVIVFLVILTCRKKQERAPVSVRILSAFLCLFSAFLIATSLSKMILYIDSYGMTRLRVYTSVFMLFLAIVFFAVFIRMFARKMPYMKVIVIAAALLVAGMCYFDVDGAIAKYNVEAYLDGRLDSVDTYSLRMLSSDAVVPYALDLVDDDNEQIAEGAKRILAKRADSMFKIKRDKKTGEAYIVEESYDIRRFNIKEYKARELLIENFDVYSAVGEEYYW